MMTPEEAAGNQRSFPVRLYGSMKADVQTTGKFGFFSASIGICLPLSGINLHPGSYPPANLAIQPILNTCRASLFQFAKM